MPNWKLGSPPETLRLPLPVKWPKARYQWFTRLPLLCVKPRVFSHAQFAALLGVTFLTLQNRNQGRRQLTDAAKALIVIAQMNPLILADIERYERVVVAELV